MANTVTMKSKVELRVIVKSRDFKGMKTILDNNNIEFLCFIDVNLGLNVITVLDITILKIPILYKLMKDAKIEDLT